MKTCKKCLILKDKSEFYLCKRKNGQTYLSVYCKSCNTIKARDWREKNREKSREIKKRNQIKAKYGISLNQYDKLYKKQGGLCGICGKRKSVLCVDHNHTTGKVRGLLCNLCNQALGLFYENPVSLKNAISYLKAN